MFKHYKSSGCGLWLVLDDNIAGFYCISEDIPFLRHADRSEFVLSHCVWSVAALLVDTSTGQMRPVTEVWPWAVFSKDISSNGWQLSCGQSLGSWGHFGTLSTLSGQWISQQHWCSKNVDVKNIVSLINTTWWSMFLIAFSSRRVVVRVN